MFIQFRGKLAFRGEHIVAFALLFNTFSWFFIGQIMVGKIGVASGETVIPSLVYFVSIIISAAIGAYFLPRSRKFRLFLIWLLFGTITSLLPITLVHSSAFVALANTFLMGVSLGLGIPSCLAYFAHSIPVENRGKIGGITLMLTFMSTPLVAIVISKLDLIMSSVLFALWRGWGLPILLLAYPQDHREIHYERTLSFASIFRHKPFILYFVAWLMFSLVDGFEYLVLGAHLGEFRSIMRIVEPIIAGFSALAAGIVSDWVGRKRVLIFGFVSLGIAYAIIGIFSQVWGSWLLYFVVDGIAIGLLWLMFTIVLWGEVARNGVEKYYAVGETPFFLTQILSLLLAPYVALIPENSAFSLAAFFLFIAVIPLLYAPETVPEKKIRQRQLKIYTKEALKLRQEVEQKKK